MEFECMLSIYGANKTPSAKPPFTTVVDSTDTLASVSLRTSDSLIRNHKTEHTAEVHQKNNAIGTCHSRSRDHRRHRRRRDCGHRCWQSGRQWRRQRRGERCRQRCGERCRQRRGEWRRQRGDKRRRQRRSKWRRRRRGKRRRQRRRQRSRESGRSRETSVFGYK